MYVERICPICGGTVEQHKAKGKAGMSLYGERLSLTLSCDNAECGFGLAFPFDAEVYCAYVCEEIRTRTRALPADARVEALLASLSYCRRSGEDVLSKTLLERVNVIFMEALGNILRGAREMLRALSCREPNDELRRSSREQLRVFLRFLSLMDSRYPTKRLESEFLTIENALRAIDLHYELGMLALPEDPANAEMHFEVGAKEGGIRSSVAYVKYILAERAESEADLADLRDAFAALAPRSQEACYEYICRAEVGEGDILSVLRSYEETTYPSLSNDGKIAFLRLELTSCTEHYEPTLAALLLVPVRSDTDGGAHARLRRVLAEMTELILRITVQCEEILRSVELLSGDADYAGDPAAERAAAEEENVLIEYVIGCAMYYRSMLDVEKRFDISYLREASGHFSCFLSSDLMSSGMRDEIELPSLIGFRNLRTMRENAVRYRHALNESAGLGGGGNEGV